MSKDIKRTRIETQSIVIGYAMSRLDLRYLTARGVSTWRQAFAEASRVLAEPPASFKNLRDEFDPLHPNPRAGWHRRPLRINRQRVLDELKEVSDDALIELVSRIFSKEEEATIEAIDSLAVVTRVAHNVAERLLTGRRAEDYFLENCHRLTGFERQYIIDFRQAARGFDFGIAKKPELAIEVKGLKKLRGEIVFTDREWIEAKFRRNNYWVVVVGNLGTKPIAKIFQDPYVVLNATCSYQKSVTAVWRSKVAI